MQVTVSPETVRMLELGHPWVIADRHTRKWPAGKAGDLVQLADEKGRVAATAPLDPKDRVVARVLAFAPLKLSADWLATMLRRADALRRAQANLGESTAWRLVNGEGDGLPGLTIERYDEHLMLQLYSAAWQPHLPLLTKALQEIFAPAGIYVKGRPQETRSLAAAGDSKRYSRLLAGTSRPGRQPVREHGLDFLVDLEQGLNTGLFLDQRDNRQDLRRRAAGKRVLNLFAYTGSFSVAAAAAGAAQVTSVDVSAGYLEWAKDNFSRNRLPLRPHAFVVGDCFAVLAEMQKKREQFDLILMDPPSFSTTGKSRFTTRQGTAELVTAALALLPAGGVLITSSNHQKTDLPDYLKELRRGALQAGCDLRVIRTASQPADFPYPVTFPEGRYLKYLVSVKA
ncbi:MAG: class I SAM-dependent rRNA methyltransferase [Desulfuromonadales bacterium]